MTGTSHDDPNATPQGKDRIATCRARSCGMLALPDGVEARDAIRPAHRAPLQVLVQDPPFCVAIGWRLAASRVAADPGYLRGVGIAAETGAAQGRQLGRLDRPRPSRGKLWSSRRASVTTATRGALVCETAISSLLPARLRDRKSTRLNSSHLVISYAVFCLK